MTKPKIGIIHPGEMGISVAASAQNSGYAVHWASEGRSESTRNRAEAGQLIDLKTLARLCQECSVILSVCPPHSAEEVANAVLDCGFAGTYLDANAVSPQKMARVAQKMAEQGVNFVDGGIIGEPAWKPRTTWLYLCGKQAETVAHFFAAGPLETKVIGTEIGKASALKMCFAANTKGTVALICAIVGAAESLGVRAELSQHWTEHGPQFALPFVQRIPPTMAKAWRFSGEMEEIAETFKQAGLPEGFYTAAAETYHRLRAFKNKPAPPLEDIFSALLSHSNPTEE